MKVSTLKNYLNRLPRDFDNKEITYRDCKTGTVYNTPEYIYVVDESDSKYLGFIFNYENPITNEQIRAIHAIIRNLDISLTDYHYLLKILYGVSTCKDLTEEQASSLIEYLNKVKGINR